MSLLLPQLVAGLGPGAGRDFAAATAMVASHLASRATLGLKLLNGELLAFKRCQWLRGLSLFIVITGGKGVKRPMTRTLKAGDPWYPQGVGL